MLSEYDDYIKNNKDITDNVFGFAGVYPVLDNPTDGKLHCVGALEEPMRVGIVEGYNSVCYKRSHFTEDFFENGYKYHYNDDLAVFAWLGLNGVEKWCIPYRFEMNHMFSSSTNFASTSSNEIINDMFHVCRHVYIQELLFHDGKY